jgi:hypothetical protein
MTYVIYYKQKNLENRKPLLKGAFYRTILETRLRGRHITGSQNTKRRQKVNPRLSTARMRTLTIHRRATTA